MLSFYGKFALQYCVCPLCRTCTPKKRPRVAEKNIKRVFLGLGTRSMKLARKDKYAFVAVNLGNQIVAVNTEKMKIVARIPVDSFPVGLDVSENGETVWVTSQARGRGGNSIGVYAVEYFEEKTPLVDRPE